MEIPLPEDDDYSEDEFDGYIDEFEDDVGQSSDLREEDVDDRGSGNLSSGGSSSWDNRSGSDESGWTIPEFLENPGCTTDMTGKAPIDFFQLMVTDEMLVHMVDQTNLFARQYIDSQDITLTPHSRVLQWDKAEHNLGELKKFLAVTITMGLINYPRLEDYWSTSWPFATNTFSSILKRDRFSLLLRFLHLNDSTQYIHKGDPGHDPLFKLRPFLDSLLANFKGAYVPGREVSVDESMIRFKGQLWFIQYMPKKPTKWGMKAFVLADSNTGYTYSWRLYSGKCTLHAKLQ